MADLASPDRFETPPKMNSVIERASSPRERATNECASSWMSTDTNSSSAVIAPRTQYSSAPGGAPRLGKT